MSPIPLKVILFFLAIFSIFILNGCQESKPEPGEVKDPRPVTRYGKQLSFWQQLKARPILPVMLSAPAQPRSLGGAASPILPIQEVTSVPEAAPPEARVPERPVAPHDSGHGEVEEMEEPVPKRPINPEI